MKLLKELDFNGNGWHLKVGQVYSSPHSTNHFVVSEIRLEEDWDIDDAEIHYKEVNPNDYSEVYDDCNDLWHRAWWVNDGNWDLEQDIDLDKI